MNDLTKNLFSFSFVMALGHRATELLATLNAMQLAVASLTVGVCRDWTFWKEKKHRTFSLHQQRRGITNNKFYNSAPTVVQSVV